MSTEQLIARLRAGTTDNPQEIADLIEAQVQRITKQQTIMDKCASTLVEAIVTEDGIDSTEAEACIEAVRGALEEVGKTTTEQMLDTIYGRIGAAAGLAPNTEFNPLHVLDQMRLCIAAQSKNGQYLELLLPIVFWPTPDGSMRLHLSPPGAPDRYLAFPKGTPWTTALDAAMRANAYATPGDEVKQAA